MNTPLEDRVHDALHRRVDPIQRSPLTVTDVRRRAGRIRRNRTIAAGAAVAAVLAIAVPVGLSMNGPAQRTEIPPVTRTPQDAGPVRIDPRSATVGDAPKVALVDTTGPTLTAGGEPVAIPEAYDQIAPFRDGWVASVRDEGGDVTVQFLLDDFTRYDSAAPTSGLTVADDGSRVAFAFHDGNRWIIVDDRTDGEQTTPLPDGPYQSYVGTIGFVSDDEVLAYQLDEVDGTFTTFLADGDGTQPMPWIDQPQSVSTATGMIAARTTVTDGRSCSALFDGRTRATEPLWTDCDHDPGPFSPDGALLVGFAPTPGGNPRGLSILDATTGESLIDFEVTGARTRVVGIATQVVWEDDEHLLATYVDGNQQYVVRLGLDGTVERVAGPVGNDDYTLSLRLTPGRVD